MKNRGFILLIGLFVSISQHLFAQDKFVMTVSRDGKGDFTTIQAAINASKAYPDQRVVLYVKNGIYKEKIVVPACNTQLSIIGESVENTIITFDDYFNKINRGRNSTFYTYTMLVLADDFRMENVTVENTAGTVGQAIALYLEGDRSFIRNCRILGNQDTLLASGHFSRQCFRDSFIEGTTDFIFGEATCLFENCTIHCKANSFITAASTPDGKPFGFVFKNCKITAAAGVDKVFLGRPWRGFAKVAYLDCEMGSFIRSEGWDNWSKTENEKTARFAEYNNTGKGASVSGRVLWSLKLSEKEAAQYTPEHIFIPLGWETDKDGKWYRSESK